MLPHFGYNHKELFLRDWLWYVGVNAVLFFKVVLFFFVFGHGISYYGQPIYLDVPFASVPVFGSLVNILDYFFHQLMHLSIAVWVFLVAKHARRIDLVSYALLFALASFLHNVGYWLTASHPSWAYSVMDYFIDYFSLWFFLVLFRVLMWAVPALRKVRVPFLESRTGDGAGVR